MWDAVAAVETGLAAAAAGDDDKVVDVWVGCCYWDCYS